MTHSANQAEEPQHWKFEDIVALLEDVYPSIVVSSVEPGPDSYSNQLWLADTTDGKLLVRVPGRTADHEYVRAILTATELASQAGIPTVQFRDFVPTTRLGLPVTIQEFLPGESATAGLKAGRGNLQELARTLGGWVGVLHGIRRDTFGPVTTSEGFMTWAEFAANRVSEALSAVPESLLPASRVVVEAAFDRTIYALNSTEAPSLIHGDLYLDNVLVSEGSPAALLDFEHAYFGDRFADFGKLTELLFEWWPGSKEPFMEAYREYFPADPSDEPRLRYALGLYALNQTVYFARWQPDLVPVYRERLAGWLTDERA